MWERLLISLKADDRLDLAQLPANRSWPCRPRSYSTFIGCYFPHAGGGTNKHRSRAQLWRPPICISRTWKSYYRFPRLFFSLFFFSKSILKILHFTYHIFSFAAILFLYKFPIWIQCFPDFSNFLSFKLSYTFQFNLLSIIFLSKLLSINM